MEFNDTIVNHHNASAVCLQNASERFKPIKNMTVNIFFQLTNSAISTGGNDDLGLLFHLLDALFHSDELLPAKRHQQQIERAVRDSVHDGRGQFRYESGDIRLEEFQFQGGFLVFIDVPLPEQGAQQGQLLHHQSRAQQ